MPVVSLEQAFAAFGFSPAEAARMAAENRAANGLEAFGYSPDDRDTIPGDGGPDDEDEDEVDILDFAEEERQNGNLKKATEILIFALASCRGNPNMIVVELKAHVKLAYVYHEQNEFAKASKEFQGAFDIYEDWMTENVGLDAFFVPHPILTSILKPSKDRKLHPVSYLPLWADCCDKLGQPKKAERLRTQQAKLAEKYQSYWGDPEEELDSDDGIDRSK